MTKACDASSKSGSAELEALARCQLACLSGGDCGDALAAFTANERRFDNEDRREARWLLFQATGDRTHLAEAKRLLDEAVANVPDDVRASMLANLRLNRDIAAAAKAAGL